MAVVNVLSVSGGKDSTAMWLWAIENDLNIGVVAFADVGNEHPLTYGYVDYLESKLGPIQRVRADFSLEIARKREYVATHWFAKLTKDEPGRWVQDPGMDDEEVPPMPDWEPDPQAEGVCAGSWMWMPFKAGLTAFQANSAIERAKRALVPTGNPFLDLCLWKGRFPSTKARFCTEELKVKPIERQVYQPIVENGNEFVSYQAVRADESRARSMLAPSEELMSKYAAYVHRVERPLLRWTVEEVFAIHKRHGIMPNPLYKLGMGRVGCMPCIQARKNEIYEISRRFPEVVARIVEWERLVALASKYGASSFFATADGRGANIEEVAEWSHTMRGGTQYDLFKAMDDIPLCVSLYGLCE